MHNVASSTVGLLVQQYTHTLIYIYRSVLGKRPLLGKHACTEFQGVTIAASIQTYGIYIPGKCPCGPKSRVMFKRPWVLTLDTTVYIYSIETILHDRIVFRTIITGLMKCLSHCYIYRRSGYFCR